MKQVLVVGFLMALSARAADTDVGVMAPLGASADEATRLTTELRTTLTLRSMSVTDPVLLARIIAIGCEDQSDACLVDVAREVSARHLLRTRVTKTDAGYTLDLSLLDVGTGAISRAPPLTAGEFNVVLNGSRSRLLELLQPGSQKGVVVVRVRGDGAAVSVDGVSSKIGEPISLGIGTHTLDVVAPGKTPASKAVNVEADGAVEVAFCVDVDAVVEGDGCAAVEKGESMPLLALTGGIVAGVGGVALLASAGFGALSGASAEKISSARRNAADKAIAEGTSQDAVREADGYATAAVATLSVGISLSILGAAALIAGTVLEETP